LHNNTAAAESYRRVLQLEPEQIEARLGLGELLLDLTQADEALPHLEYLHRKQPENLIGAVALARCYDQLGRQNDAETILDDILARHPNFFEALFCVAVLPCVPTRRMKLSTGFGRLVP